MRRGGFCLRHRTVLSLQSVDTLGKGLHVVDEVNQDVVLLGHHGHAFLLKLGKGDHGRCDGDVPVVLQLGLGVLDFLREFLMLLVLAGLNRIAHGLGGFVRRFLAGCGNLVGRFLAGLCHFGRCFFGGVRCLF